MLIAYLRKLMADHYYGADKLNAKRVLLSKPVDINFELSILKHYQAIVQKLHNHEEFGASIFGDES